MSIAQVNEDMGRAAEKNIFRRRYEQFMYWYCVGRDGLVPTHSSSVYVLGYIKSGTNWLCHLLSGALDLPILEPWKFNWPPPGPYVFHMHRFVPLSSVRRRTVYMMRDGRDAVVSHYFQIVRQGGREKKKFEHRFECVANSENIEQNLPAFIRYMQDSKVATTDYRSHIMEYLRHKDQFLKVRYEDMLVDAAAQLARITQQLTGSEPDMEKLRAVVRQHEFSTRTKRARGQEDNSAFARKGISGDWRNYFSTESARVYDEYAGELLVELGYEKDHKWVNKLS